MQLNVSQLETGIKLVKLTGRLDMQGTMQIENAFTFATSTGTAPIVVEMSEVDFLASIGMRLLLSNAKALARRGAKMALVHPTPVVKDALTIAGFDQLIPMYDELDAAYAALALR